MRQWVLAAAAICLGVTTATAGQVQLPTLTRDEQGRATVRAVRVSEPMRVDGRLDEAVYGTLPPATGFIETEPRNGQPAEERTDVWVLFDDDNLYVVARNWESRPDRRVANEMRRDNGGVLRGDHFAVALDTFFDRRSAVVINANPIGGRMDGQVAAGGGYNGDWNPVWNVQTADFEGGWSIEFAFPFKTLRYREGQDQTWGITLRRRSVWNNEIAYLTPVPAGTGTNGTTRPQTFGTLVGVQVPPAARNIEIKPYAVSSLLTDRVSTPRRSNDLDGNIGLDAKYAITQSMTANFTVNTDFAQVEADEQQVNLTRFSLSFPEKREFFLENSGAFNFGGGGGDVPTLFYSRRVGLNSGREVPIRGGGKLVAQSGRTTLGILNMETGEDELAGTRPTNFTAVRLRRDILRISNVGLIFTNRSIGQTTPGTGQTFGADAAFNFFANLSMSAYYARTEAAGPTDTDNASYRGNFNYNGDRYGLTAERLVIGRGFNPEVGFVRRGDIGKSSLSLRFSPRPTNIPVVRKFSYSGSWSRIATGSLDRRETENLEGEFGVELRNSDTFEVAAGSNYEFLARPFTISPGVIVPVGGYDTRSFRGAYNFGRQRPISGNVSASHGTFYTGHLTTLGISQGRFNAGTQLSIEPSFSVNWVDLAQGSFTTRLLGSRVTYTLTPQMFTTALVQYNASSHLVSINARLRWEYRPGSEFFIVYNDQRDTLTPGFPDTANRALVVKVNRLLNF
jgi:hypothetical protein